MAVAKVRCEILHFCECGDAMIVLHTYFLSLDSIALYYYNVCVHFLVVFDLFVIGSTDTRNPRVL